MSDRKWCSVHRGYHGAPFCEDANGLIPPAHQAEAPPDALRERVARECMRLYNEARGLQRLSWEDYDPDVLDQFRADADRILSLLPAEGPRSVSGAEQTIQTKEALYWALCKSVFIRDNYNKETIAETLLAAYPQMILNPAAEGPCSYPQSMGLVNTMIALLSTDLAMGNTLPPTYRGWLESAKMAIAELGPEGANGSHWDFCARTIDASAPCNCIPPYAQTLLSWYQDQFPDPRKMVAEGTGEVRP